MVNDSASGGFLQPVTPGPGPLSGRELLTFLQNWLAPLCNLDGSLVRPAFQSEPSDIPDAGDQWVAFWIGPDQKSDTFPYVQQTPDGLGFHLLRNEELEIRCAFYDTGVTGFADATSRLVRDNLAIPQNWEALRQQEFMLGYVGPRSPAPRTLANRWLYRVDMPIVVRCQIERKYQVLSVQSMQGTLYTDTGLVYPLSSGG